MRWALDGYEPSIFACENASHEWTRRLNRLWLPVACWLWLAGWLMWEDLERSKPGQAGSDQKVLPETRNRPLLPRDFSTIQPSKSLSYSSRETSGFTHPTSVILIRPG